jgi:nicotinic acid phosphoribosyltransferase
MIINFEMFESVDYVDVQKEIAKKLEKYFEHIDIKSNSIYASSRLTKGGKPLVRIDSKDLKALWLKFDNESITIKTIVNDTDEKGFSRKILDIIISSIDKDWTINIDQDVSGGYWENITKKEPYKNYNWKWI